MKIIDFHVHIGRKEHWKEWVHHYQKASGSDFYERYEELTDPGKFALYLKGAGIERAVILPEISPITTGVVSNEYVLDLCRGNETLVSFCTVNPSFVRKRRPSPEMDGDSAACRCLPSLEGVVDFNLLQFLEYPGHDLDWHANADLVFWNTLTEPCQQAP